MKSAKVICKVVTVLLVIAMLLGTVVSCGVKPTETSTAKESATEAQTKAPESSTDENESGSSAFKAKIAVSCDVSSLKMGESVRLTVTVEGTPNTSYTWSVDSDLIAVDKEENTVTVVKEPTIDTVVHVTATLDDDKTVSATKTLIVKAPVKEGQVGELTSDMLAELGNASITASA